MVILLNALIMDIQFLKLQKILKLHEERYIVIWLIQILGYQQKLQMGVGKEAFISLIKMSNF